MLKQYSWVPSNSKRKQGRPRIARRRTFKNNLEWAGTTWEEATTLAKDRDAWKLFAAPDGLEDLSLSK